MWEYLLVQYSGGSRTVYSGSKARPTPLGSTNRVLRVPRGRRTYHLGAPDNYFPAKQIITPTGTDPRHPWVITFLPQTRLNTIVAEGPDSNGN